MHFSARVFLWIAFLPAILAAPATPNKASTTSKVAPKSSSAVSSNATGSPDSASMPPMGTIPSDKQIMNAVLSWQNDTGKVSKFMNTAASFSGDEFTRQATIALNAELDELNHKMILDMALGTTDAVQKANDTLVTKGTFQAVVDVLQLMVSEGPDTAQANVDTINANRCVNVLPNIDAYFAAAGSPDVTAIRPTGCLEIQAAAVTAPVSGDSTAPAITSSPDSATASGTSATRSASTGKTAAASKAPAATGTNNSTSTSVASADAAQDSASADTADGAADSSNSTSSATTSKASKASSAAKATALGSSMPAAKATAAGSSMPRAAATAKPASGKAAIFESLFSD